jgi:agmatinase
MKFFNWSKEDSEILLLGIPYEGKVVFKKGSSLAPDKIRWASESIEFYSPYQKKEVKDFKDIGNLNFKGLKREEIFEKIEEKVFEILKESKKFVLIGGDHTITYPSICAVHRIIKDFILIHIDAHLDRREMFEEDELNYATVIKKIEQKIGEENVYTFGARSCAKEEKVTDNVHFFKVYENIKKIENVLKNKKFYVSLDLDVLDPSFFPAVTNPEPGGINFNELIDTIIFLSNYKENITGFDVVEYNPMISEGLAWSVTASIIIREIIGAMSNQ